ncbi:Zn-dependent metalloprotease [Lysobacter niastensis]|uniref:Neutral metalloproteinase n=1 Tax=Lysobacter niastensis TaxID=380629 RepID=A0ABU1W9D2_9GAMM|nr:M4 family metallopeptidase [Lysobacter niastensis]MDR7133905.1 Zn-dependent metalloprotease [Lysobacter niastensis]
MSSLAKALSVAILMGAAGQSAAAINGAVVDRALVAIRQNPTATRLSAADAFSARSVTVDRNGTEHVRMDRTYGGLPVLGGDIVVHSRAGTLQDASLTLVAPINVGITPALTVDAAITAAGVQFGTGFQAVPSASLVVYARGASPKLAYDVLYAGTKTDGTPTRMHYYVDALNGAILGKEDAIKTGTLPGTGGVTGTPAPPPNVTATTGTGRSLIAGVLSLGTQWNNTRRIFEMKDPTRGNTHITDAGNGYRTEASTLVVDADNKWGNGATTDRVSAAVDASYGFAKTWDFYKEKFGREGIRGDGVGAFGAVHYSINYVNAYWSDECFCMAFGDGNGTSIRPLVTLDIMGHEMSHGLTSVTAGLIYSSESGGLNEANSDILGTMVEYYVNNAQQPPNYIIGEGLFVTPAWNKAIRWMFKPNLDGISPDCYPSPTTPSNGISLANFKAMDVHYSSGVANHFYYLLAEGAVVPEGYGAGTPANLTPSSLVCNGNTTLAGIGREAAQQIWYRALTVYMVSNTDYAGARVATLNAAADLYGAGSANHNAVAAAWDAVTMQ